MYLETIVIVKTLFSLLIAFLPVVKPKPGTLTFVITCLKFLDHLKHRSAQSV